MQPAPARSRAETADDSVHQPHQQAEDQEAGAPVLQRSGKSGWTWSSRACLATLTKKGGPVSCWQRRAQE